MKFCLQFFVFLISVVSSSAQPYYSFISNSNLRIRVSPTETSPNWIGYLPYLFFSGYYYRIEDYYQELKSGNDLLIAQPDGNKFFRTTYTASDFYHHYRDTVLPWHYGKFYFEGTSDIGIDSGIILSTGRVLHAKDSFPSSSPASGPGCFPGIAQKASYNSTAWGNLGVLVKFRVEPYLGTPTIPRLQQYPELVALNNGRPIADANIFEFDVQAYGDFISLDYVFASEEWPLNSCDSGADVMAIMISGPGIVGEKNIAVLPGTTTPVTTHTVYPGNLPCHSEPSPSPWYVDNTNGQNVIYNGFTKVLRAASPVQPCQTYHIRVMVADGVRHPYDTANSSIPFWPGLPIDTNTCNQFYDYSNGTFGYDAGVFLKMGSLRTTDTVRITALGGLSQTAAFPYAQKNCYNARFRVSTADSFPIARTYTIQYAGNAVAGVDYQSLPTTVTIPAFSKYVDIPVTILNTNQADRTLMAMVKSSYGSCMPGFKIFVDTAALNIVSVYPVPILPADTTICAGCSVQLVPQLEPGVSYTYQWSPNTGLSNAAIAGPTASPAQSTQYTLQVAATNVNTTCAAGTGTAQVNIGTAGIGQSAAGLGIGVYPNPARDELSLSLPEQVKVRSYRIVDLSGRTIKSGALSNTTILIKGLSSGSYWLQLDTNKGLVVEKIVKE
jgi:hypothetical protein